MDLMNWENRGNKRCWFIYTRPSKNVVEQANVACHAGLIWTMSSHNEHEGPIWDIKEDIIPIYQLILDIIFLLTNTFFRSNTAMEATARSSLPP